MTIHEVTFKFDDESLRHRVLLVLFEEIRNLELLHNELDARITAAFAVYANDKIAPRERAHLMYRALTKETPCSTSS